MPVTKALLAVVGTSMLLALAGCGTTPVAHLAAGQAAAVPSTSTSQSAPVTSTTKPPATTTTAGPTTSTSSAATAQVPPGWKPVAYESVHFAVPALWPVYDLRVDPNRCVQMNVHAVYLGRVGPHPRCPA